MKLQGFSLAAVMANQMHRVVIPNHHTIFRRSRNKNIIGTLAAFS